MRHFRTFCHNCWNGRSSLKSCLRTELSSSWLQDFRPGTQLPARAQATEDEVTRVQARLDRVESQLDRFRAKEFWDRVMREVAEILTGRGGMTPAEILPELRTWTIRGAALHKEPLTAATLKKKMDVRVSFGRYFEPCEEGRYARRAG